MQLKKILVHLAIATAGAVILATPAFASTGGGGLPWEGPLQQIQESINGPVAGAIALAAMAIAGGMLIFGGELNDFARRLMRTSDPLLRNGVIIFRSVGSANS